MRKTVHLPVSSWIVSVLAFSLLFVANDASPSQEQTHISSASPGPVDLGMVALLAAPEKYESKVVRVIGFLCIEFEGDALYLHEEDYRYGLTKDSFALRLTDSQRKQFKNLNLKYVLIEGTVYANGPELDMWSGAIGNIVRFEAWPADRGPVQPH